METTNLLLAYYKDMLYVFGFCPCCGEIFNLGEAIIRLKKRPMQLPKYSHLLTAQESIDAAEEDIEKIEERYHERLDAVSMREEEFKHLEPEIIRKVKVEGRRQAMNRIKKIDKIFTKKSIDPRDIRLVCSPVDFISFNGMTQLKEIDSIEFIRHMPKSTFEEKTLASVEKLIKKGNVDFVLIRVTDKGTILHDSIKQLE